MAHLVATTLVGVGGGNQTNERKMMNDLPDIEVTEPEYMSWDIDKLRGEYHKLKLRETSLKLREHNAIQAYEQVQEFVRLLKSFVSEDE